MLVKDFSLFLKEYNIVSLAVAFVMGSASTTLSNSLVKDVLMPLLSPLLAGTSWREATFTAGKITIAYGSFLAELFNFLILAFVIFFVVKKMLNMNLKGKK